jgi:hypothetical protein
MALGEKRNAAECANVSITSGYPHRAVDNIEVGTLFG